MKMPAVYFLLVVCLCSVLSASSQNKQASTKPISYKQPDGTSVTITLKGDQNIHWAETQDGYSLIVNNKTKGWEYAKKGCGDRMVPSGKLAHDPESRSSKENKFLESTPKSLRYSDRQIADMTRKKR